MSIPHDFNYQAYLSLNPDLKQSSSYEEAVDHYIHYGSKENRRYNDGRPNTHNEGSSDMRILVVIVSCNKHDYLWGGIKNRTSNELVILSGTNDRNRDKRWYDKNGKEIN